MKLSDFEEIESVYKVLLEQYGINRMTDICQELYEKFSDIISLDGVTTFIGYECRKAYTNFSRTDSVIKEKFDSLFSEWNTSSKNVVEIAEEHNIVASVLLRAFALYLARDKPKPEEVVFQWFKEDDKNVCQHKKLAMEINTMTYSDPFSGHLQIFQDRIRGKACENYVKSFLDANNISYFDEELLRQKGYPVTPDFVFELPMVLVRYNQTGNVVLYKNHSINFPTNLKKDDDVVIVSWLECKGMFATEKCHKEYHRRQYNSYVSCFGEGIVFYQYGFVEFSDSDKKVICIEQMPEIRVFEPKLESSQKTKDFMEKQNPFVAARYKAEH